jgi:hypothetical protein
MSWSERIRRLSTLVPWTALLMAVACGGGDKGPTGPGGGQTADDYELVALGATTLPADTQVEDCIVTRFYSGRLQLHADGTWTMGLQFNDDNYGDAAYEDSGSYEQDGGTVRLDSKYSGVSYEGTLRGSKLDVMYDWCYNGVPDVQLVFGR